LIPPSRLRLSDWIEANITLPEGISALPGAIQWLLNIPAHGAQSPQWVAGEI